MKEVYKGSQLLYSVRPAVEPYVLFDDGIGDIGISITYEDPPGSAGTLYVGQSIQLKTYNSSINNRVLVATFNTTIDVTDYNIIEFEFDGVTNDWEYSLVQAWFRDTNFYVPDYYDSFNLFSEGTTWGFVYGEADISSLIGSKYLSLVVKANAHLSSELNVRKIILR